MIVNNREYTNIGTINNLNRIYDFGYDGAYVVYSERLSFGNHNDTTINNNINFYDRMNKAVEKIFFSKVCDELVKEYGNIPEMEKRIESMSLYIGTLEKHLSEIRINENISLDFSTTDKAKETERNFLSMCDDIFNTIDSKIKSEIKKVNRTQTENEEMVNQANNNSNQVFGSTYINTYDIQNYNEMLDIELMQNNLTEEERERVNKYMTEGAMDELSAMRIVYNEREGVKEFVDDGFTLDTAIMKSLKEVKVKKPEPPKPNKPTGYIDMFALLIVGEVFIYGLIIAILLFIK